MSDAKPPTVKDLDLALALMKKHGVTQLEWRGIRALRPLEENGPGPSERKESELERLHKLSPEAQDAALLLQRTGG